MVNTQSQGQDSLPGSVSIHEGLQQILHAGASPKCPLSFQASLSSTFLHILPELVTPMKGHSISLHSCGGALFISTQLSWGILYLHTAVMGHSLSLHSCHGALFFHTAVKGHSLSPHSCKGALCLWPAVKGHSLSLHSCPLTLSTPSKRSEY